LHYCRPKIQDVKAPWGELKPTITYEGLNHQGQWVRLTTHPGKITENVDQAIARDLLAHGMMLAHKQGIDIRLHVHDQIVGLSDEDKAEAELEILQECMRDVPTWAPGMPLGSAGFVSKVFMKD
jgi:DNA polymerase